MQAKDLIKLLSRVHPDTYVTVHLDGGEYAIHVAAPSEVGTHEDIEVITLSSDSSDWIRVSEMTSVREIK
jgi:hypothetical protein